MIKRSFFGLARPKLRSPIVAGGRQLDVESVPLPKKATLYFHPDLIGAGELLVKRGDSFRSGQKVRVGEEGGYLISPVTGTVSAISQHTGYLGRPFRTISVDVAEKDEWDREFDIAGGMPTRDSAVRFMGSLPGAPDFGGLLDRRYPLHTVFISAMEQDLLIETSRSVLKLQTEEIREGIAALKSIIPAKRYIFATPPDLAALTANSGAEGRVIDPVYPNTLPRLIIKKILGKEVPSDRTLAEVGIGFLNVEAVASLGKAFRDRVLPVDKVVTVIPKDLNAITVKARIGTPVGDVLNTLKIGTEHGDRILLGGPMRGMAVFSEDMPVLADTDALMIQSGDDIVSYADNHCVNCGECVRICPAKVPVNMLIRLLENGLFEEAAERYDLFSCVECGLCSFVCIARIPIFQYIMLGKYEFERMKDAEEANA